MLKNVLLIFFSIVLSGAAFEFGLRAYDRLLSWQYPEEDGDETLFWEYDSLLGWKLAADKSGYYVFKESRIYNLVKTNSKGLRDSEYGYKKQKGVKRILLLGDSMTAGFEVNKESVVDTRLEHYLGKHGNYEVINAGFRGYGTDQLYLWFKHEGYKYEPDIVVYVFYDNDPMNNITIHNRGAKFGKPFFTLNDKNEPVLNGVPVPAKFEPFDKHLTSDKQHQHIYDERREINQWKKPRESWLHRFHIGQLFIEAVKNLQGNWWVKKILLKIGISNTAKSTPEDPEAVKYRWRITKALIRSMKILSDGLGAKFLVYESTYGDINPVYVLPTRLKQVCEELGVHYFESFREFYEVSRGKGVLRFRQNIHWNERGHDMAAKSLYEYLRASSWI